MDIETLEHDERRLILPASPRTRRWPGGEILIRMARADNHPWS